MLNVYLDTQHISRIASQKSDLRAALDKSSASLFFSQTHVIESLPKNTEPPQKEIARLQFIMSPESNGLIAWSDFPKKEFQTNKPSLDVFRCEINEILFPEKILISRSSLIKAAKTAIKKELAQISDQKMRRSQQAKFIKRGQLTPAAIDIFSQEQANTINSIATNANYLLPLISKGGIYDLIAGHISESEFNLTFKQTVANPIVLAGIMDTPELSTLLDMSKFFWTQTDALIALLNKLVEQLIEIQIRTANFNYKMIRERLVKGDAKNNFATRAASGLVGKPVSCEKLKQMHGTKLYIDALWQYLLEKLDRHANSASKEFLKEVKFKRSDFADLNHLFYAPYMSVFGCDKDMKNIVRKTGYNISRFVSSDEDVKSLLSQ
jgi:hypothetical protein